MSYKYRYDFDMLGRSYVEFNISPEVGNVITPGTNIHVDGHFHLYDDEINIISVWLVNPDKFYDHATDDTGFMIGQEVPFSNDINFSYDHILSTNEFERISAQYNRGLWCCLYITVNFGYYNKLFSEIKYAVMANAVAPTISSISISDSAGALSRFGALVDGESKAVITCKYKVDPIDTNPVITATLRLSYRSDISTKTVQIQNDTGIFTLTTEQTTGLSKYVCTITDRFGLQRSISANTNSVAYYKPRMYLQDGYQLAERWAYNVNREKILSDDGINVWLNCNIDVGSLSGKNAWSISYDALSSRGVHRSGVLAEFADGIGLYELYRYEPTSGFNSFSANSDWDITIYVTDWFGNKALLSQTILKAGGYFNIEKTGVSVGMRSGSAFNDKRFEVAPEYMSYFYGGIAGVTAYNTERVDTGGKWIDGRSIYRQTFDIGDLSIANGNVTTTIHSFKDFREVIDVYGKCYYNDEWVRLPYGNDMRIGCSQNSGIRLHTNFSSRTNVEQMAVTLVYMIEGSDRPPVPVVIAPSAYTASTTYSSKYPIANAFDGNVATSWASASSDSAPYIIITLPNEATEIEIDVYSRNNSNGGSPSKIVGKLGVSTSSSDDSTSVTVSTNSSLKDGSLLGTVKFENTEAKKYIRLNFTKVSSYVAIGNIVIRGIVQK